MDCEINHEGSLLVLTVCIKSYEKNLPLFEMKFETVYIVCAVVKVIRKVIRF